MRCIAAMLLAFAAFAVRAAPEHSDWGAAVREIGGALQSADFQRLEAMHATFLDPGARTQDGTWMIEAFQLAFGTAFRNQPPGSIEKLFKQWRERAPASTLRPIAEAFAWKERAWLAKGSGCYAQRPSSARKAFNDLIARAESALRESEVAGQNSPLWHTAAMFVAGAQARPAAELDALLAETTQRFPAYQPLFVARMTFLLPEWGGDFGAIDAFARASAQRTQESEGRAMYAWLYIDLARNHCGDLFDQSLVEWADMRAAFEDMLARHPADWNLNLYATFACRARDAETTARLLGELGSKASLGIGSGGITTDGCRQMLRRPERPSISS